MLLVLHLLDEIDLIRQRAVNHGTRIVMHLTHVKEKGISTGRSDLDIRHDDHSILRSETHQISSSS